MKTRNRGMGRIYLRGKIWWLQYTARGRCVRESARTENHAEATRELRKRIAAVEQGKAVGPQIAKVNLGHLVAMVLDNYKMRGLRSGGRVEDAGRHLTNYFGAATVAISLTADKITAYIVARQTAGAAAATINRELSALKRGLALSAKAGLLNSLPAIEMLEERNVRQGFIEHGQFLALREALPAYLKDAIAFLYFSAWRREEALSLEWRDVEATAIRLRPEASKNGRSRLLPLRGELAAIIERRRAQRRMDCTLVFHQGGKRLGDFRAAWRKALVQAELSPGLLVHDLRRSGIRNLIRGGTPEGVAMAISGHKTRAIFSRYDIVDERDLILALDRTGDYLQRQPTGASSAKVITLSERG